MNNGWTRKTLGDLCDNGQARIQTGPFGSQLHSYDYQPTGVPVVPTEAIRRRRISGESLPRVPEEIVSRLARHRLKAGDILFARRGAQATGLSALVEPKHEGWLCGTGAILLRLQTSEVDPTFLSFALSAAAAISWLKAHAVGAVMPNLNEGVLRRLPLLLPPPKDQRAIGHILSTLDDKIELNRRMNETLEELAQALFESWFVQAVESGLPEGWRESVINDSIEVLSGGTPKTTVAEFWGGEIPWYSVEDSPAESDVFVIGTKRHITQAGLNNSATQVVPEGTTIISARGTVGKLALTAIPMAMNQSCYAVRGAEGYPDYFTYYHIRRVVADLRQQTHGTVFETITRQTFTTVKTFLPPVELAQEFDGQVEPIMKRICCNVLESRTLAVMRDALLPKLLSGEIRLKTQTESSQEMPYA